MSEVFGSAYADAYDLLYAEKDYGAECDLIEGIFQRYSPGSVSSVLDLGCGTGRHAFSMASRGYDVVGVERSESMLAVARQALAQNAKNGKLCFQPGDIRNIDLGRQFDAALIMFAVLGYQLENGDVLSTLKTARRHLKSGGLLIFDVWYGPAVLHQRPADRVKIIPTKAGKILRVASGELDVSRHVATVRYHLWRLAGKQVEAEIEETHLMRYFFPLELKLLLESSDFNVITLGAFPDFDKQPDESTWNVLAVARAS